MQCRKIQELLKSDYLDGESKQRELRDIKEHLEQCPECSRLEKELQGQRMLFQKVKRQQMPERVWQNIRDTIVEKRLHQESSIFAPRPLFAFAGALTALIFMVIFAGDVIQKNQPLNKLNGEEIIAGYGLNGESEDSLFTLGTDIEEYFL